MAIIREAVVVLLLCSSGCAQYDVFIKRFDGMPHRVLQRLASHGGLSACRGQAQQVLRGLRESSLWAASIVDASAQGPPSGFLQGSSYALGNFEQCVHSCSSKYCLATITVHVPETPQNGTVWQLMQEPETPLHILRNVMHWGFCLPVSCRGQDLQEAVQGVLESGGVLVHVSEENCYSHQEQTSSRGLQCTFLMIFAIYAMFIVTCSLTEHYNTGVQSEEQSISKQNGGLLFRKMFSIQYNWKILTKSDSSMDHNIECIYGMRSLCMLIVILGHRGEALMSAPLLNREALQQMYSSPADIITMNSHMVVDVFFVMSGFLATSQLLRMTAQGYKINLVAVYVLRYFRLTVVYVVVIIFYAFFLYDLGSGPLWKSRIGEERDNCLRNWWANVLYINNYVSPERPCVDQAWYLACDMQLFLLAPFLFAAVQGRHGVLLFSTAIALSMIIPATVTYIKDLDPTIIPYPETLGRTAQLATYTWGYVPAYCRAGPYFIGMASSFWFHKLRSEGSRLSKGIRFSGWVLTPLISIATISMALIFYQQDIGRLWSAVYAGLHRTLFSLTIGFGITASALGDSGPLYQLLSWRAFQPLSRLTYCMFLCHGAIQLYHIDSIQHLQFLSTIHICWSAMADIGTSLLVSTILYLTIESPFSVLMHHYIQQLQHMTPEKIRQDNHNIKQYENSDVTQCKSFVELCSSQVQALLSPQYASKREFKTK